MGCHDGLQVTDEELRFRERVRKLREKLGKHSLMIFVASDIPALIKVTGDSRDPSTEDVELLEKRIQETRKYSK